MRIEELSAGDWVRDGSTPYKVTWIEKGAVGLRRDVDTSMTLTALPIYFIQPIPITAEILEKNGWLPPRAEIDRDTWWWTNKVDTAIEASEYQGEWQLTIIEQREIQYNYRLGLGLKNVHQLQHALRLAGVEKEIEI